MLVIFLVWPIALHMQPLAVPVDTLSCYRLLLVVGVSLICSPRAIVWGNRSKFHISIVFTRCVTCFKLAMFVLPSYAFLTFCMCLHARVCVCLARKT